MPDCVNELFRFWDISTCIMLFIRLVILFLGNILVEFFIIYTDTFPFLIVPILNINFLLLLLNTIVCHVINITTDQELISSIIIDYYNFSNSDLYYLFLNRNEILYFFQFSISAIILIIIVLDVIEKTNYRGNKKSGLFFINLLPSVCSTDTTINWNFLPEIIILVYILVGLLYIAYSKQILEQQILLLAKILKIIVGFCSWIYVWQLSTNLESNTTVTDTIIIHYNLVLCLAITLTTYLCLLNTKVTDTNTLLQYLHYKREHSIIIALILLFLILFVIASNFIWLIITLLGFSIGIYVLFIKENTRDNYLLALEASQKYFLMSAISSILIWLGIFCLYKEFGTLQFHEIRLLINFKINSNFIINSSIYANLHYIAIICILIGFFFKLAIFPFNWWLTDVYAGSQKLVLSFLVLPVKIASIGIFIYLITYVFGNYLSIWQPVLLFSAICSILYGCIVAFRSKTIPKFIAATSINQFGFILAGSACGMLLGYLSTLFYILVYMLANSIMILLYIWTRSKTRARLIETNYLTRDIRDLLFINQWRSLIAGWTLRAPAVILFFSMAGIPPLAGFISKFLLLYVLMYTNCFGTLFIGLSTSIISCYYYLNLIVEFNRYTTIYWFDTLLVTTTNIVVFIYILTLFLFIKIFLLNKIFTHLLQLEIVPPAKSPIPLKWPIKYPKEEIFYLGGFNFFQTLNIFGLKLLMIKINCDTYTGICYKIPKYFWYSEVREIIIIAECQRLYPNFGVLDKSTKNIILDNVRLQFNLSDTTKEILNQMIKNWQ